MTSNPVTRLAAYALVLAVLFGAGLLAGDAFGPQRDVADGGSAPSQMQEPGHGGSGHGGGSER
jgi:hypothetical protein